jgi:hypothetical protein
MATYRDPLRMDTVATITVLIFPEAHSNLLQREMSHIAATSQIPSLSE